MSEAIPQVDLTQLVPIEQLRAMQSKMDKANARVVARERAKAFAEGYSEALDDLERLAGKGYRVEAIISKMDAHVVTLFDWAKEVANDETKSLAAAEVDGLRDGDQEAEKPAAEAGS